MAQINWDATCYSHETTMTASDILKILKDLDEKYQAEIIIELLCDGNDFVVEKIKKFVNEY